ncbi:guanine nucleotide-binding protein alpha-3 subunit [Bisporella sp. PMI_857]|nr:guanine nucleotide-binding protein alpha-3 subunit [Bisporella sp. PMI_857]
MKQADRIKFQVQIPKIRINRTEEDEAKKRSAAIDRRLEEDSKRSRREVKVLLLGSGDSGKEDIVKQMKIIHLQGLSESELYNYRPTIFKNVLYSAKAIIQAMDQFDITPELEVNKGYCEYLMGYHILPESPCLEVKVGKAIFSIWNDPCIEKLMEHRHEFYLMESASYFFEEVERIAAPDYLPIEADVLRARTKTNGIYETRFQMGALSIHLFDVGGQRSERKKWIHSFENVNTIIFVVNLSDYDQVLLEESSQNAMMESLLLFDSVVNSRWFQRTSIVLLLNKVDVFREKLARSPLSNYFPDYSGGQDVNKAAKYILWRFNQVNRAHLPLYPHLVQATDTSNIRLVFAAIKETILNNALRGSGIFG